MDMPDDRIRYPNFSDAEEQCAAEYDELLSALHDDELFAPADVQRQRVLARPGMTARKLDAILERQLPDADKRARADFVVETNGSLAETEAQVAHILACLGLGAGE